MTTTSLMPSARARGWTNAGLPAAGCLLYTYESGTTTPKAAYTDAAKTVPHTNPIVLDAKGEALIYWEGNYRVDLKTAAGVQVTGYPVDDFETPLMSGTLLEPSGGGMVGFLYEASYGANTLGKWLQDLLQSAGASFIGCVQLGIGAVLRNIQDKVRENVSVFDYMTAAEIADVQAGTMLLDVTAAIQAASLAGAAAGGCLLRFPRGYYKYTRLTIRSNVTFIGDGPASTFLICSDPITLDAGVAHGSSIRKLDDGVRVVRAGFRDMWIGSGTSGVAALETTFQNIMALNICACERTVIDNVTFAGMGQGAIVLARAEAGAEGLGFTGTTQDGNYNKISNVYVASCGRYNADQAAIWCAFKANSNKFYAMYFKPVYNAFGFRRSNDNAVFGGSVESSQSIAVIGTGGVAASSGNALSGMRAEGLTGDAYVFNALAADNTVLAGYHTGVTGENFNLTAGPNNRVISGSTNYLRSNVFPPSSSYSTLHNLSALKVSSINGSPTEPLYIKSPDYNTAGSYPEVVMYNDLLAAVANDVLGAHSFRCGDVTAGAAGVSARISAIVEGTNGLTGLALSTGTGSTLTEFVRLTGTGVFRPATDNTQTLGSASNRWSTVYAGTGAINTSDERQKQQIQSVDAAALRAWGRVEYCQYKFNDAVAAKGDAARLHVGVVAQRVKEAFETEGLDAFAYGILCYDEWDAKTINHPALYDHRPTGKKTDEGEDIYERTEIRAAYTEHIEAGNRYGVRYEEALALECAYLRSKVMP